MSGEEFADELFKISMGATENIAREFAMNSGLPANHPMNQQIAVGIGIGLIYKYGAARAYYKSRAKNGFFGTRKLMKTLGGKVGVTASELTAEVTKLSQEKWISLVENDPETTKVVRPYIYEVNVLVNRLG